MAEDEEKKAADRAEAKAILQNHERLAQLRVAKAAAETGRDWDGARDADYELRVREAWARELAARGGPLPDDATKLQAKRAQLDAERQALPSPLMQAEHDWSSQALRARIDAKLAGVRATPAPDPGLAERAVAARAEYARLRATNPVRASQFAAAGREGLIFGDGGDDDPRGSGRLTAVATPTPTLLVGRVVGRLGDSHITVEIERTHELRRVALPPGPRIGCMATVQVDGSKATLVEFSTPRETVAIAVTPHGRKQGGQA